MTSDLDPAVEAAARSMFVTMTWTRAVVEPEAQRKSQAYYEAIVGQYWDSGTAGESNYKGFRELAENAVRSAKNDILAGAAPVGNFGSRMTIDNSGLDPRFGVFLPPSAPNKLHNHLAANAYRTGWLKRPDAQVVAYL
jgi:hypothetical protein